MQKLSRSSLEYAINECISKTGYRVVICGCLSEDANAIIAQIKSEYPEDVAFSKTASNKELYFVNGSIIRFHPNSLSAHGSRCHLVLYDDSIDEDVKNIILRHFESLRWVEPQSSSKL